MLALVAAALDRPPAPVSGQARASDGDSFRIGSDRIRLLGIDAPELAQQCTDGAGRDWPCGRVARDRMADLLAAGAVDCRPEGYDRYDRLLATCFIGPQDLGATMVVEGLAVSAGPYWQEQVAAQQARAGIWSGDFDAPRDWRDDQASPRGAWGCFSAFGL